MPHDWPLVLLLAFAGLATVAGVCVTLQGIWVARRSQPRPQAPTYCRRPRVSFERLPRPHPWWPGPAGSLATAGPPFQRSTVSMTADPTGARISADLDAMIARAEGMCERHRTHAEEAGLLPAVARNRRRKLQAMQLHVERLRARRARATR